MEEAPDPLAAPAQGDAPGGAPGDATGGAPGGVTGGAPGSEVLPADLKVLVDAAPGGVFRSDETGTVVYAGGRVYQRAGLAGAGAWGERWSRFLHPDRRDDIAADWERAVRDQTSFKQEYQVVMPDGAEGWLLSEAKPQFDASGRFIGHVGTTTDITELKNTEAELRDGEERYRSIIAALGEGVILAAADGTVLECNVGAARILGTSAEELTGRNITRSQHRVIWDDGRRVADLDSPAVDALLNGRSGRDAIVGIERADGTLVWVRTRSVPLRRPGEAAPFGIVISLVDITAQRATEEDLRRAKEEAEAANRTKSAFLTNMSHELRTPLNAIIGFAEIMRDELLGPLGAPHYREYASDIHQSGRHLLDLINDILDLSKVEAGRLELHEEDCNVPALLAASLRLMNERAHASDLRIEQRFPRQLPLLRADARSLKQILLNLVSNAIKFTPSGGRIVISAEAGDGAFALTVADTGIGMTPDGVKKALEAFGQVDSSLSRKYEGTGLGLPLTRALVELHGGRLEIESALGDGTRVTAVFPGERIIRDVPPV